ncbi:hypothetical protein BDY21DRAFT_342565 [Lineolata rhizophorae]|uniref:Uncharacterized protein n=1 Tax=Lineolata rhizophorae TaxID=578093 RepID=A0A6A6P2M7_9PEZI|nr:hypothetical protein BDY21DRAFT_342565 [Lineolata rhizophorae]
MPPKQGRNTSFKKAQPKPASSTIPSAFHPTAPSTAPFQSNLKPGSLYLTHIDTHSPAEKRNIFILSLLPNALAVLVLAWRIRSAYPTYISLVAASLALPSAATVDIEQSTWANIASETLWRTAMLTCDLVLVTAAWKWVVGAFVSGPGYWRWKLGGVKEREVVVRMAKTLKSDDVLKDLKEEEEAEQKPKQLGTGVGTEKRDARSVSSSKDIVPRGLSPSYLRSKTGYLMQDREWALDFPAMVTAHLLLDSSAVSPTEFGPRVWAYCGEAHGWCVWDVGNVAAPSSKVASNDTSIASRRREEIEEDARRKMRQFETRVSAIGHEDLFFRWLEVLHYESSRPGANSWAPQEKKDNLLSSAKELFTDHGVDFEQFVAGLEGGISGVPGLAEEIWQ